MAMAAAKFTLVALALPRLTVGDSITPPLNQFFFSSVVFAAVLNVILF